MSINDNNGGQNRPDLYEQLEIVSINERTNRRNEDDTLYHRIDSISGEIRDFLVNEADIRDAVEEYYRYNRHKI